MIHLSKLQEELLVKIKEKDVKFIFINPPDLIDKGTLYGSYYLNILDWTEVFSNNETSHEFNINEKSNIHLEEIQNFLKGILYGNSDVYINLFTTPLIKQQYLHNELRAIASNALTTKLLESCLEKSKQIHPTSVVDLNYTLHEYMHSLRYLMYGLLVARDGSPFQPTNIKKINERREFRCPAINDFVNDYNSGNTEKYQDIKNRVEINNIIETLQRRLDLESPNENIKTEIEKDVFNESNTFLLRTRLEANTKKQYKSAQKGLRFLKKIPF